MLVMYQTDMFGCHCGSCQCLLAQRASQRSHLGGAHTCMACGNDEAAVYVRLVNKGERGQADTVQPPTVNSCHNALVPCSEGDTPDMVEWISTWTTWAGRSHSNSHHQ